jgi:hypothetical protein
MAEMSTKVRVGTSNMVHSTGCTVQVQVVAWHVFPPGGANRGTIAACNLWRCEQQVLSGTPGPKHAAANRIPKLVCENQLDDQHLGDVDPCLPGSRTVSRAVGLDTTYHAVQIMILNSEW